MEGGSTRTKKRLKVCLSSPEKMDAGDVENKINTEADIRMYLGSFAILMFFPTAVSTAITRDLLITGTNPGRAGR